MRLHPILLILLGALACGSSDNNSGGGTPGGTTIGSAGGTVTSGDGKVQLTIPAGALSNSISISVTPDTATATTPGSGLVHGSVYDIEPTGTTFATPVTLKFSYTPDELPAGSAPVFLRVNLRDGSTWDSLPSIVDTTAHTVTAQLAHFSTYGMCTGPCLLPPGGVGRVGMDIEGPRDPSQPYLLDIGSQLSVTGYVQENAGNTPPVLQFAPLPTGFSGSIGTGGVIGSCTDVCSYAFTASVNALPNVVPGTYTVTINILVEGQLAGTGALIIIVNAVPGFALSTSPVSLPLAQGGQANMSATITRTNFTAPVTLSAVNLPGGLTASFSPATLSDTALTSLVTFTATNAVPAGSLKVVIRGTAAGAADQADTVTLVVAPFAITVAPVSGSVAAGGSTTFGVKAIRAAGFNSTLTYAVTGLPAGVTASFATTGVADSSSLTITAAAGATPGLYPLEVTATAGAVTQQAPISLVVTQSGGGLRYDWSGCSTQPLWVGFQDGSGAWTQVAGSGGVYQIPAPSSQRVGLAVVLQPSGTTYTQVQYMSSTELSELTSTPVSCDVNPSLQTYTGTAAGTDSLGGAFAFISMGGAGTATRSNGPFSLTAPTGTHDLTGYLERTELSVSDTDLVLIKRNVSTPGTVDFSTATQVASAPVTVQGGSAGDFYGINMFYISHACEENELYAIGSSAPAFTLTGVPDSLQSAGDLHAVTVNDAASSGTRRLTSMFHAMGPVNLTLGAIITPTVSALTSPYRRLSLAMGPMPNDYSTISMLGSAGAFVQSVLATRAYFGSDSVKVTMPDLTGATGFSSGWEAGGGSPLNTSIQALSNPFGVVQACGDGVVIRSIAISGTY